MLDVQTLRELWLEPPRGGTDNRVALSAASGLACIGQRLYVVADDENHLAAFELSNAAPGRLFSLVAGELPQPHAARKAAKPDFEALLVLPAFAGYPGGALMALGSGSRRSRQRAALLALDGAGGIVGPARSVDLAPLYESLVGSIAELNIEGAFVQGDTLCLLQRGHSGGGSLNARIDLSWPDWCTWLAGSAAAPRPRSITPFQLGAINGVPLSFTDGAALPDGGWLFSAAAENTADSYADGACAGSVIGRVDAHGTLVALERLALTCKVEGIVATLAGDPIELLMVTDADDRSRPALLLSGSLRC